MKVDKSKAVLYAQSALKVLQVITDVNLISYHKLDEIKNNIIPKWSQDGMVTYPNNFESDNGDELGGDKDGKGKKK